MAPVQAVDGPSSRFRGRGIPEFADHRSTGHHRERSSPSDLRDTRNHVRSAGVNLSSRQAGSWTDERSAGFERQVAVGRDHDHCPEGCLGIAGYVLGRGRFAIEIGRRRRVPHGDGPGGHGTVAPGAVRGRGVPGAHVGTGRSRRRRCRVTTPEVSWGHSSERAVRGWVASPGPAATVGEVGVPVAGLGGWLGRGHAACDSSVRWRVCGHAGCRRGSRLRSRRIRRRRLATWTRDAPTRLMPEQKPVVPACPRRGNGHWWRFDRARSTRDCQADVCQACGLVRLTSYRTGQVVCYEDAGAGDGT